MGELLQTKNQHEEAIALFERSIELARELQWCPDLAEDEAYLAEYRAELNK